MLWELEGGDVAISGIGDKEGLLLIESVAYIVGLGVTGSWVGQFAGLKEGGTVMGILDGDFVGLGATGFWVGDCVGINDGGKMTGHGDDKSKSNTDRPQVSSRVRLQTVESFSSRTNSSASDKRQRQPFASLGSPPQ